MRIVNETPNFSLFPALSGRSPAPASVAKYSRSQ
jgi:hypothetical protein